MLKFHHVESQHETRSGEGGNIPTDREHTIQASQALQITQDWLGGPELGKFSIFFRHEASTRARLRSCIYLCESLNEQIEAPLTLPLLDSSVPCRRCDAFEEL